MAPARSRGASWRRAAGLVVVCGACACGSSTIPQGPAAPGVPSTQPIRVLMLTATAGFRHDSIATARQVLAGLAATSGEFTVTATEDLSTINATNLAMFDVVFFALTTGELAFTDVQKAALLDFVSRGGGFMGAHSATDTLYEWPEYGQLVGAYFKAHPWTQSATVIVEDQSHPSTAALGASFSLMDEFYTFRENPRPAVQVLLRLDAASVGSSGDFPLAWVRPYGNGRSYYNALGHFASTWNDPRFQQQLLGAIRWTGQ